MIKPCRFCGTTPIVEPSRYKRRDYQCDSCAKEYKKPYNQLGKKRCNELHKKYRKDPKLRKRHLARDKASREIKSGRLARGNCIVCKAPNAQAHHEDYSKPLEITWLCASHHRQHHDQLKAKGK